MVTHPSASPPEPPSFEICGLRSSWDPGGRRLWIGGVPSVAFLRDASLVRVLADVVTRLGPRRFSLLMQAEGRRSAEDEWPIVAAAADFEAGFAALGRSVHVAGWGRWELVSLDRTARRGVLRVHEGWEAAVQRSMGVSYGVGLVAGEFAGLCERVFGVRCWPREVRSSLAGDPHDEIVVEPSERSVAVELAAEAREGRAVTLDLRRLFADLSARAAARERAPGERDRMVVALQDRLRSAAAQQASSRRAPIVQLHDEVLAVPLVGALDEEHAARTVDALLATLALGRAGFAILDVTGVERVDPATAANLIRILREVEHLGVQGLLSGIDTQAARTLVELRVDLSGIRTFSSVREALAACLFGAAPAVRRAQTPGVPSSTSEERKLVTWST